VKTVHSYARFFILVILAAAAPARGQNGDAAPASQPQTPQERLDGLQAENRRLRYQLEQLKDERAKVITAMREFQPPGAAAAPGAHAGAPATRVTARTFKEPLDIVKLVPAAQRPLSGAAWNDNAAQIPPAAQLAAQWLDDNLHGCIYQGREPFLARNVHGGRGQIVTFEILFDLEKTMGAVLVIRATFKEECLERLAALKETELVPFRGTISYAGIEPQAPVSTGPRIVLELEDTEFYALPSFMKNAQNPGPQTGK